MIIRNGNYTTYQDFEFCLSELRQEAPIPFTHFVLKWDLMSNCPVDGFSTNGHGDCVRILKREEIKNAFKVITYGLYQGKSFIVEANTMLDHVSLKSLSPEIFEEFGLTCYKAGDELRINEETLYATKYFKVSDSYSIRIPMMEIDRMWEERFESDFELPLPEYIEKVKYLSIK